VDKYGGARMATDDYVIQCMRFACQTTTANVTHSENVMIIASR